MASNNTLRPDGSDEIISMLTKTMEKALKSIDAITNPEQKAKIAAIIENLKNDLVLYFEKNIDRRKTKREKTTFEDLLAYFAKYNFRL